MIFCLDETQVTCSHQIELAIVSEGNHVNMSAGSQGLRDSASLVVVACAFLTCLVFLFPGKSEVI